MPLAIEFDFVQPRQSFTSALRKGYRNFFGRLKRWSRWEFWPPYLFYPPVAVYIAYLGIKFRNSTLFTAANPAIPASGFVGESKHQILENLRTAASWLPHSTLLTGGSATQRLAEAEVFMHGHDLQFPVVLKPDAGQRGSGVSIIRSFEQMQEYLTRASFPVIVQEYIPGEEYGVFYYRYPGDRRGRIFSVTEKQMPVLLGDGKHTLEELILADDRAVCMTDFYLRKNSERIQEIPGMGEKVKLVEIGTHCRGAIFLDGGDAITPELEEVVDQIAQSFDGFYFGRFDIRVPSRQDFRAGRNLTRPSRPCASASPRARRPRCAWRRPTRGRMGPSACRSGRPRTCRRAASAPSRPPRSPLRRRRRRPARRA